MATQGNASSRELKESRYAWCLLPLLLLLEAVFVGSTFNTTWWVLGTYALAASVVTIFVVRGMQAKEAQTRAENKVLAKLKRIRKDSRHQLRRPIGVENDPIAKPPSGRSALAMTIGFVGFFVGVSLRVGHHMQGNLNPVAMLVDSVAHGTLFATVAFWLCFPRRGHPIMLPCGLILVLCTVTAGGVSHSMSGQLLAAFGTVLAFSLASGHILRHWQLIAAGRAFRRRKKNAFGLRPAPLPAATASTRGDDGRTGMTYTILAISALLMLTTVAGQLASAAIPGMQLTFLDRLSQTLESVTSSAIIGGTRYVRGSKLGEVRRHMIGDPAEPAVRVYSERAPGYLRGNVFDSYNRGRWKVTSREDYEGRGNRNELLDRKLRSKSPATVATEKGSIEDRERFELQEDERPNIVGTLEVHNVPMKGNIVFTALTTKWIEAEPYSDLEVSFHDVIASGTVNSNQPYVLGIGSEATREVLGEARREVMLTIPSRLKSELTKIASSICEETITPRGKAQAIEEYFQANFKYSLQRTVSPKNVDPILHFLNTQHPSHCEFFASAAAMLLRSVGVPTRYVTGYVATEWSDENDYYLARNRDAHAWVEAYDNLSEQWFPVEATVGRTYVTLTSEEEEISDGEVTNNDLENADESVSIIDRVFAFLGSFRTADSLTFLFRVAQLPLFCMVVVLMWIRHRQRQRRGDDPMEFESRKMLMHVDRRLRKHDLVRAPSETLHQFAIRVDSAAETSTPLGKERSDLLSQAADWYRSFASARYRGLMPVDWAKFTEAQTSTV